MLVRIYESLIEIRDLHTLELIRRHPRATRKGEVKIVGEPVAMSEEEVARAEALREE